MTLTKEEIDVILNMLDIIEDDYGLSSWELELKEKLENWSNKND